MDLDFLSVYKMKRGDMEAGEHLIRKYYPEILRYCYLHQFDRDCAEDIAQETFVRFFAAIGRYEHRGKVKNYLYTIAANLCRNESKRTKELPLPEHPEQETQPIPELEGKLDLYAALERLPMELRQVAVLYYFRQYTLKEISGILKISPSLVRKRLERTKQAMRRYLEGEEWDR